MALILAIESSCDETSVAITRDGKLLANVINTQIEVHQKYGGVMPEIASRLHCENISLVLYSNSSQYPVSLASFRAICSLATKSAFPCAYCASRMFAPMEVPERPIWLEITDSCFAFKVLTRLMTDTAKSIDCMDNWSLRKTLTSR